MMLDNLIKTWRRKKYRKGATLTRHVARDIRREFIVEDASRVDVGLVSGRVRTWNVLYAHHGTQAKPDFGAPNTYRIKTLWDWDGEYWGGPVTGHTPVPVSEEELAARIDDNPSEDSVFVVRKISYGSRMGPVHAHEYARAVATEFGMALGLAMKMGLESDPDVVFEITQVLLNKYTVDAVPQVRYLDHQAQLLARSCAHGDISSPFKPGDIIRIQPFPRVPCSTAFMECIGVVAPCAEGAEHDAHGRRSLAIHTINRDGHLALFHVHTCVASAAIVDDDGIPEYLSFLKTLRDHLTGEAPIAPTIWSRIQSDTLNLFAWRNM